ncbi:hypothetical protein [Nostoc sp.]|uniref:hypothetical protein n=1 Tax=Nostoc sp. TaxID=1180 RepID=UPI002FFC1F8A
MSYYLASVESFFHNMSVPKYENLRDTIEKKLNTDEFLVNKTSVYQTTSLYKEAHYSFILEDGGDTIASDKFNQLAEQFRNERWKIFYEFGLWCVNAYTTNPYWFYKKAGIEFTCKAIGCLTARDSPIELTIEEKNYVPLLLIHATYNMSPGIADDILIKWSEVLGEINYLNSLSNPIH